MVRGDAWLTTDGIDEPIRLFEGEMAIVNARSWLSLRSGTECGVLTEVAQPSNGVIARLDGADPESATLSSVDASTRMQRHVSSCSTLCLRSLTSIGQCRR